MPKLSDVKIGGKIFALFVGHPGSGKDIAANSFPGPIYNFDLDKRIDSVAAMFGSSSDIEYDQFGPEEFPKLWDKVKAIKDNQGRFKTIVMSSLTALARMGINYSISLRGTSDGSKTNKGVIQMTEVQDFGAESRVLSMVLEAFRSQNFKANFILTAHLVETNSKTLGGKDITMQRVVTAGKVIGAEIPAYFNEIYLFEKTTGFDNKSKYMMRTTGEAAGINTKTILPLPNEIDFTMKKGESGLYSKIQEECRKGGIEIG